MTDPPAPDLDRIPDARDGLTRVERVVLWQLREAERERPGRPVATVTLYGRVVEHVSITVDELQAVLARLTGKGPWTFRRDSETSCDGCGGDA